MKKINKPQHIKTKFNFLSFITMVIILDNGYSKIFQIYFILSQNQFYIIQN